MGDGRLSLIRKEIIELSYGIFGGIRAIVNNNYLLPYASDPKFHKAFEKSLEKTPELIRREFHFIDGRREKRCAELGALIIAAQDNLILEDRSKGYGFIISKYNGEDILKEKSNREEFIALAERLVYNLQ